MAYFNAIHAFPSLNALTESGPFTGTIEEGKIVTRNGSGQFELVGSGTPAARNFYISFYNSTDSDIASTDGDATTFGGLIAQDAAGISGGNLATLPVPQNLEAETDQYIGTPAIGTELTVYGVAGGDSTSDDFGKLRAAAAGEMVVGRVTKAASALQELPGVTTIRVNFNHAYPKA